MPTIIAKRSVGSKKRARKKACEKKVVRLKKHAPKTCAQKNCVKKVRNKKFVHSKKFCAQNRRALKNSRAQEKACAIKVRTQNFLLKKGVRFKSAHSKFFAQRRRVLKKCTLKNFVLKKA